MLSSSALARAALALLAAAASAWLALRPAPAPPPRPALDSADAEALRGTLEAIAAARAVASGRWSAERDPRGGSLGEAVVAEARRQLDEPDDAFRDDCSGFVSAVYSAVGVPMDGVVASLWDLAVEHDTLHWDLRPQPGDLIFFDDTHDRNRNGRWDDVLTHVGLVLSVDAAGTITFAHAGLSRGRRLGHMNLTRPADRVDEAGRPLNDPLRVRSRRDPPGAPALTGELWVGFARVDPARDWHTWEPWVPLR